MYTSKGDELSPSLFLLGGPYDLGMFQRARNFCSFPCFFTLSTVELPRLHLPFAVIGSTQRMTNRGSISDRQHRLILRTTLLSRQEPGVSVAIWTFQTLR